MRALICTGLLISLASPAIACRGNGDRDVTLPTRANRSDVTITGCVTSDPSQSQFVLTAKSNELSTATNRAATGDVETFAYRLVGGQNLQSFVGQEVTVKGDIEGRGDEIELEARTRSRDLGVKGDDARPAVNTKEEINLQLERFRVESIDSTGTPCR